MSLRAEPNGYAGPCPVTVTFSGMVTLASRSGPVTYRFVRSDGASGLNQTLSFGSPGSQPVSTTLSLGSAGSIFAGWEAVEILSPVLVRSGPPSASPVSDAPRLGHGTRDIEAPPARPLDIASTPAP